MSKEIIEFNVWDSLHHKYLTPTDLRHMMAPDELFGYDINIDHYETHDEEALNKFAKGLVGSGFRVETLYEYQRRSA